MIRVKTWLVALILILLCSCADVPSSSLTENPDPRVSHEAVNQPSSVPVQLERAYQSPDSEQILDVAIVIFDIDSSSQNSGYVGEWIFQEILEIERQYLPTVLRSALVSSNQWGVVRVLPQQDLSMDLWVLGTIIRSDGAQLDLNIQAVDSTGRQWMNKLYSRTNSLVNGEDPFQDLYDEVANDLLAFRQTLSQSELKTINRVSDIRHATDLSPDSFSDLLIQDEQGLMKVARLLADNDPMQGRIERMRFRHNVFIDTLDDYYQELNCDMEAVYDLWRHYSREQILEIENEIRKDLGKSRNHGGFTAMTNNYYRYKSKKLFEQEWRELAEGFTRELAPQIMRLNNQVYSLKGSVEDQYVQWRKILKQFYLQERGL